jgi:hypothetical protein
MVSRLFGKLEVKRHLTSGNEPFIAGALVVAGAKLVLKPVLQKQLLSFRKLPPTTVAPMAAF